MIKTNFSSRSAVVSPAGYSRSQVRKHDFSEDASRDTLNDFLKRMNAVLPKNGVFTRWHEKRFDNFLKLENDEDPMKKLRFSSKSKLALNHTRLFL